MAYSSGDPCAGLDNCFNLLLCCCVANECARTTGEAASRDKTVGIALALFLGVGTIATCLALGFTSSHYYNAWTGTITSVSNARYIPIVAVCGGVLTLIAFAAAASAPK